jgi:hypothetical protein
VFQFGWSNAALKGPLFHVARAVVAQSKYRDHGVPAVGRLVESFRAGAFGYNLSMKHRTYCSTAIVVLLLAGISTAQQSAKLKISGTGIQSLEFTSADLAKMPRLGVDVRDPHSGEARHYEGVRVSDLLAKVGASLGDKLRGEAMLSYVVARAMDGYAVVYSLAELDPTMIRSWLLTA